MLELENFLPYRLSVLANQVSQGIARTYEARHGLSVTEWRVIAILGRYPGLAASEVAARAAMDKVAVSRAVARLQDAGHIERRDNPSDRRAKHLRLSATGREVYDAIVPAALAYERELLSHLDDDERRVFEDCLARLIDATAPPD